MKSNDLRTIEKKIGYEFNDKALLERAFTHASADNCATKNYQSLEFLGDSILGFVVAKKLMEIPQKAAACVAFSGDPALRRSAQIGVTGDWPIGRTGMISQGV